MTTVGLTARQAQLLKFLRMFHVKHERMPTLHEQTEHLGVRSRTTAWHLLEQLERRGHVKRLKWAEGGIELLGGPWDIPAVIRGEFDEYVQRTGRAPGAIIGDALLIYMRHPTRRLREKSYHA